MIEWWVVGLGCAGGLGLLLVVTMCCIAAERREEGEGAVSAEGEVRDGAG